MGDPKQLTPARCTVCDDDVHLNANMALLYSSMAPLPISAAIKAARSKPQPSTTDDYKAVWSFTPQPPDPTLFVFFHGNRHYVKIALPDTPPLDPPKEYKAEKKPKKLPDPPSRLPDWVDSRAWDDGPGDDEPDAGTIFKAAPLYYKLDELEKSQNNSAWPADSGAIKKPVVLCPEDVELQKGSQWAAPPLGQYSNPSALGDLVEDCYLHLRCKRDAQDAFQPYLKPTSDSTGPSYVKNLKRIYLSGHSGGGKPMRESAGSTFARNTSLPVDFWLLDATYGLGGSVPDVPAAYVEFCKFWNDHGQLGNGPRDTRFVCIYKQKTKQSDTETIADDLRVRLAKLLSTAASPVKPKDLFREHVKDVPEFPGQRVTPKTGNLLSEIIPALRTNKVLFIRTNLRHENIPTTFIPVLLRTAAS
ncbi:MAG TPA: hypothetical protein VFA65_23085 [Bryobacteraceae bacterium]|nr:hypothetical protein [Bryobacteraceae bacterium]